MADRCRDCSAPVIWVGTLKGRRMPLDARPDVMNGDTFIAAADSENGTRLAIPASRLTDEAKNEAFSQGLRLYRRHHMTCPAMRAKWDARAAA